ncbi:MAG: DUF4376 domain-containing protein [Fretibacterium sp.]|nr:DUF4376 domain-containing protein [Fretibacterium sp.]
MSNFVHYDEATGRVIGVYGGVTAEMVEKPYIEVTAEEARNVAAALGSWRVENGRLAPYTPPAPEPPTLEELKAQKREEIAAARYAAEVAGVTVGNMKIRTDRESQALITGAALAAMDNPEYTCRWKTEEGFVTLDAATVLSVARTVRAHVQACFDREAELAAQIDAAATAEDVEKIRY